MSGDKRDRDDFEAILGQLVQTAKDVDKDDLVKLAKMHGMCEQLLTADEAAGAPVAEYSEQISTVASRLEAIILGETPDGNAALTSVVDIVMSLGGGGIETVESPVSASKPAKAPESAQAADEDVEAQLAKVFDEEPEAATDKTAEAPDLDEMPAGDSVSEPADEAAAKTKEATPAEMSSEAAQPEAATEPPYESIPLTVDEKELEFVKGFVEEAMEHIEAIEGAVLDVERAPDDATGIDNLFRPFHTIKGMAGFLNLRDINCLTHEAETLMDQGRKGTRSITPGLIDLIFDVVDILKLQVAEIGRYVEKPTGEVIPQPPVAAMIERLRGVVSGRLEPDEGQGDVASSGERIGDTLVSQKSVSRDVVEYAVEKKNREGEGKRTGEVLIEMGAATPRQVGQALRSQSAAASVGAQGGQGAGGSSAGATDSSVRIDTAKLDALVDMVGELVIAQAQVSANGVVSEDAKLSKNVAQATKIIRDVQEVAMGLRMVPIGTTFQKMARLVRDVSRKAGKSVELTISGEDTELDKNVIQQIGDPLVHMVRNAVDHGIESPEIRRAAGKPTTGHVHLSAGHQGGNIVIEIRDDGKGLDPKTLIAKAIEKGIVQPGEDLTDQQAYQLIFAPGFSTAAQVTDISGRGVGMDVVRRNIEQLRGKIEISSHLGKGSTFTIRLPLTLAIIDGMITQIGDERFIIPTIAIEQALRPLPSQITTVQRKGEVLNVRGRLIPLIQLGQMFGLTPKRDPCETMVLITHSEGSSIGLIVDELIGQQQVVIKTLGHRFEKLRGICGAAILGDGRVGLILEASGVAQAHSETVLLSETPACSAVSEFYESDESDDSPEASVAGLSESENVASRKDGVLVPA